MLLDCVVVGAGPAGLATSLALTRCGVDHVVLERGRVGHTWRTQRWDSLRLNNPGWMNPMLGAQPRGTYLCAGEVTRRLEHLAAGCPVHEFEAVTALHRRRGSWLVRTGGGELRARTVVIATGGENVPHTPDLASRLPRRIAQCHAAQYRAPAQLPGDGVLVVGSAQSGYQIAEELLAAGRRVVVATSAVGRAPAEHRGRPTVEWLVDLGFFDQRPEDLPDPSVIRAPQPLLAPGGRSASLQSLARAGAMLVGRLTTVDGERIGLDASVAANIEFADAFADRIRKTIDDAIVAKGWTHLRTDSTTTTPHSPTFARRGRSTFAPMVSTALYGVPDTPATSRGSTPRSQTPRDNLSETAPRPPRRVCGTWACAG